MVAGGFFRRVVRIALYIAVTLPLMPLQALLVACRSRAAGRLPLIYHRLCCRILGFRLEQHGQPAKDRPVLFVVNHTSYLDITILAALVEASFIAKAEVARWPLFGWLAKLQRTVFIDRRRRATADHRDAIRSRLEAGDKLILFPEGTSGDGNHVLPFKSALFSVAEDAANGASLLVQPVSVAYVQLDGMPLGRFYRPFFAWYGDMEMGPHLWAMLGLGTVTVVVNFHPPVTLGAFGSRKALAEHCHRVIASGVAAALAGRLPPAPPAALAEAGTPVGAEAAGVS